MSQPYRRISLPLVGAILLGLLVGVYLLAFKRFAQPEPSGKVVKHTVDTPSDEVLKYWTEEKKRSARAADMPVVNNLKRGKRRSQRKSGPQQA